MPTWASLPTRQAGDVDQSSRPDGCERNPARSLATAPKLPESLSDRYWFWEFYYSPTNCIARPGGASRTSATPTRYRPLNCRQGAKRSMSRLHYGVWVALPDPTSGLRQCASSRHKIRLFRSIVDCPKTAAIKKKLQRGCQPIAKEKSRLAKQLLSVLGGHSLHNIGSSLAAQKTIA
jgi:hypothetical protein